MATTKTLGYTAPVPMGEWNSTTTYNPLNIVTYYNASYIAKTANNGFEPTVTSGWEDYWQLITSQVAGIATTATLEASAWSDSVQTVAVSSVTATSVVIVASSGNAATYADYGIYCSAQSEGSLTFTCSATPTEDMTVNLLIITGGITI